MLRLKIILQSKKFIFLSLLFIIIYILIFTKFIKYETKLTGTENVIVGNILNYIIDGNKLSMTIKAKEKIKVSYYISSSKEKEYLQKNILIGSRIIVEGSLTKPYNNTIPNTFNYNNYLYNNKIYMLFNADKITLDYKTSLLNKLKSKFIKRINSYDLASSYLYALILGESDYINSDVYQTYQENGTTHLFAVSGMHITTLVLFLNIILKKFKLKDCLVNTIIILLLLFYMFLIGFTPSVLRGGLLFIFLFINRQLKIGLNNLNILYILFLILIIVNPFYIYNLGFQYSFITSFGLILLSHKITGNYLRKLIIISFIAFLFSLPITIYNFYEINLLTIINNIFIVPLVSFILFPLTLITFIFPFIEPLLNVSIKLLEVISSLLNYLKINIIVPNVNILFVLISYLIIYLMYKFNFKYIFLLVLLIIIYKLTPYMDFNSYVYFLDVGQGDSTVVIGNNLSYAIMIDTGGKITYKSESWEERNNEFDLSANIVTFLKYKGIRQLDLLIITHGDVDHIGYANKIIKKIPSKNLWLNKNQINDLEQELSSNIKNNIFTDLNIINLNEISSKDENKSSQVLYFNIDNISFLIMGDAPKEVEEQIINKYNLKVDIIKLGHHGSKTSSSKYFLSKLNPNMAIISAGRNNIYNHPSIETINTLNNLNIVNYSTQKKGTIVLKIKNNLQKIYFYPP